MKATLGKNSSDCNNCSISKKICMRLAVVGLKVPWVYLCDRHPTYAHMVKTYGYDPMEEANEKRTYSNFHHGR